MQAMYSKGIPLTRPSLLYSSAGSQYLSWSLPDDLVSKWGLLHLLHEPKPNALVLWGHHVWNETQECKATHDRQSTDRTHCTVTIPAFHTVSQYD